jgi:aspartyl-tRNA(Asn)/glutamyl-tRNA(Gln) amidotransferase subunit C
MSEISPDDVRHIAMLSRLKLKDEEIESFTHELAAILGYMDQLMELDVEGVEPTAHAVTVQNVFREDVVRPSFEPDQALSNAPQRENSYFRVPKVLDQDTV